MGLETTSEYRLLYVREHLTQTFQDRWIDCGGPTPWAVRSPNLNPLDVWLSRTTRALNFRYLLRLYEQLIDVASAENRRPHSSSETIQNASQRRSSRPQLYHETVRWRIIASDPRNISCCKMAAGTETWSNMEVRSVIRFLRLKGTSSAEIHRQLVEMYGANVTSRKLRFR
ncbi:hypothetical protein ANN_07746 [Periplaneta americana]|uniref:Mos1 transposase HTH domain-containing protein n=1 Tax=Periplaneta americana TaxID=6978 RepID=A0ABQ8SZF2_PERAM|nr:hypothetical protein ANN_07746 [Periplaneta americana]